MVAGGPGRPDLARSAIGIQPRDLLPEFTGFGELGVAAMAGCAPACWSSPGASAVPVRPESPRCAHSDDLMLDVVHAVSHDVHGPRTVPTGADVHDHGVDAGRCARRRR